MFMLFGMYALSEKRQQELMRERELPKKQIGIGSKKEQRHWKRSFVRSVSCILLKPHEFPIEINDQFPAGVAAGGKSGQSASARHCRHARSSRQKKDRPDQRKQNFTRMLSTPRRTFSVHESAKLCIITEILRRRRREKTHPRTQIDTILFKIFQSR